MVSKTQSKSLTQFLSDVNYLVFFPKSIFGQSILDIFFVHFQKVENTLEVKNMHFLNKSIMMQILKICRKFVIVKI
uniref:Uncharacterized protein n=1 Tax=viral metagenome TaxID=1070528 RepID=A0A6C0LGN4_9ZZZZ